MVRPSRRAWSRLALLVALLALAWLASGIAVAWKLTRRAGPRAHEAAPAIGWGALRELRLTTSDREELGAWWIEAPEPRATALLLHGNASTRAECLSTARVLLEERVSCLLLTLRAHGDSTGDVNDVGWSARADVLAGVREIERVHPGLPVLVRGFSLGAAAAVFAAGELGLRVRGWLLEMCYADLDTAVRNRTRLFLPPPLDALAARAVQLGGRIVLPHAGEIAPAACIGAIPAAVPVLLLSGGRDPRVDDFESNALLAAAGPHARLVRFDDAAHEVLASTHAEAYARLVRDWLAQCLGGETQPR